MVIALVQLLGALTGLLNALAEEVIARTNGAIPIVTGSVKTGIEGVVGGVETLMSSLLATTETEATTAAIKGNLTITSAIYSASDAMVLALTAPLGAAIAAADTVALSVTSSLNAVLADTERQFDQQAQTYQAQITALDAQRQAARGPAGGGETQRVNITLQEGAIRVDGSRDPAETAREVVREIREQLGGGAVDPFVT